ncbi:TPA: hypothetical protein ACYX6P_005430, partial [Klebsiella variicola]
MLTQTLSALNGRRQGRLFQPVLIAFNEPDLVYFLFNTFGSELYYSCYPELWGVNDVLWSLMKINAMITNIIIVHW